MRAAVLLGALALAGCQSAGGPVATTTAAEPPPANYREIIAAHVRETFFDPYTVRDAAIAPPKTGQLSRTDAIAIERGWIVCVKANARNRMGGYIGNRPTAYLIRGGKVVTSHTGIEHYEVRSNCADAAYTPFHEIEEKRNS